LWTTLEMRSGVSDERPTAMLGFDETFLRPFARALIEAAPDRILCGTDWPHPNIAKYMPNDGDLVDLIPLMAPESELQQKILVDNPHRLYQFARL